LIRWDKETKKIKVEIQTWPKLKECFKSKYLIKLLPSLIDLFKDLIEEKISFTKKLSWKVNWKKIKKLIKFKDLIKLLMSFMNSIKDFIEEK